MEINEFHRGRGGQQASRAKLVQMAKLLGISLTGKLRIFACHVGLLVKTPIAPVSEMVLPKPGYLTIMDLFGPFPVPEPETGFLYLGLLVDVKSSRLTASFMMRKQEIPTILDAYFSALARSGYVGVCL